ncbi:MAG: ferredoxin [Planctomycetota bacterium]|nr:ferredoxin [Planctomycetota bacterium]MDG2143172.1 ferredoxin [Planctomycetota bacterium]
MGNGSSAHLVVRHKAAECIGCCLCEETAPEYFYMDDDGMAQLRDSVKEGVFFRATGLAMDQAELEAAAEGCPVDIIRVSDR